ncbi:MAG: recombinase RecT [Hyphomicrobiales bacterium]|nr:recombinase RecT [Hyphomicrobiales bacterium]
MVGANGSALPIYKHEQNQSLNDHHLPGSDRENDPIPHSQKALTSSPRRARSVLPARGPKPLLPRSLKEALQLASLLSKSKLVPKGFENPEACLVGILYGMEVGLSPIAALQRMAIIEGRPTIWGDAALALVQASGLLIKIEERIENLESQSAEQSSDWPYNGKSSRTGHQRPDQSNYRPSTKTRTAICQVLRSGRSEPIIRSFSIEDAKRAGLWQKPGPWTDYPDRMLMMRARAFALRDAFPDVLTGLYIREEFEGSNNQGSINHQNKMQSDWDGNAINQDKIQSDWDDASPSRTGRKEGDINTISTAGSSNGDHRASDSNDREGVWHSYQTRDGRDPKLDRSNSISHSRRRAPPPPPIEVEPQVPSRPGKQSTTPVEGLENNEVLPDLTGSEEAAPYQSASVTLELFDSALACAKDEETLEEIREEFTERIDRLDSGSLQEAGRIFLRHEKRIRATEAAFKTSSEPSDTSTAQDLSIEGSDLDKSGDGLGEIEDELEECDSGLIENATVRIGKEPFSPHSRRRFSIRPRKGLSLAELNARRKLDLLKYLPRSSTNKEDSDE